MSTSSLSHPDSVDRDQALPLMLDLLPRLVRLVKQAIAGPPGEPLTLTQFRLLRRLSEGSRGTGQLARQLNLSSASISASIDGLVRRGLVERLPLADDRRMRPLGLTREGRLALEAAQRREQEAMARIVQGLSDEDALALAKGLAAVRERLDH